MSSKQDRSRAEIAAEHLARELGAVATVRAVRTKWQRVDLFGADVLGMTGKGTIIAIQATAGESAAVTARRRKLERYPWHVTSEVLIAQLRAQPDPNNRRRLQHWFRVHEYARNTGTWELWDQAIRVPREWFKALPKEAGQDVGT